MGDMGDMDDMGGMGGMLDMEGTCVGHGGGMSGWYIARWWMRKGGVMGWNCWLCCCIHLRQVMAPWRPAVLVNCFVH